MSMRSQDLAHKPWYAALGFHTEPFSITPDISLAFPGEQYVRAYEQLHQACQSGVLAVLTAEIGLGKTFIVRGLISSLPVQVRVAYLFNPVLDQVGLLRAIYSEFNGGELPMSMHLPSLHHALVNLVLQGAARGERFVVIVDEAHRLSADALETLRLLSNLETEQSRLISLMLVGQPELERTLALRAMRPLRERIGTWVQLHPMNREDCCAYVQHRIARTHTEGSFHFSRLALWWLHWRTKGVPRRINLAAERVLQLACRRPHTRRVNWLMVWLACRDYRKAWK